MADTYLVTGGMGCIGAWTLAHLQRSGKRAVNFDQSADRHRIDWLMSAEEQGEITFVQGDLRDSQVVKTVFAEHRITHVIHLAALQVPFCRANPVLGAEVNVTGTVNVFEAAKAQGVKHIAFASSIGVYGPPSEFPPGLIANDAPQNPRTLYGAYKVCNEQTAQVYYHEEGLTSTCLRPYTVYGVGRNQGMTSEPTKALVAAVKGQPLQDRLQRHDAISTGGRCGAAIHLGGRAAAGWRLWLQSGRRCRRPFGTLWTLRPGRLAGSGDRSRRTAAALPRRLR